MQQGIALVCPLEVILGRYGRFPLGLTPGRLAALVPKAKSGHSAVTSKVYIPWMLDHHEWS